MAASRSVGAGLAALKVARAGGLPFSLMRPPGHHATRDQAMGFCYFNSIAIAALEALGTGAKRVAVKIDVEKLVTWDHTKLGGVY